MSTDNLEPFYISAARAGRLFPSLDGRGLSPQATIRSMTRGIRAKSREGRIFLRFVRTAGRYLTTREWVEEFLGELTRDRAKVIHSATVRERALRARAMLRAKG
jgi:hypothetical protein